MPHFWHIIEGLPLQFGILHLPLFSETTGQCPTLSIRTFFCGIGLDAWSVFFFLANSVSTLDEGLPLFLPFLAMDHFCHNRPQNYIQFLLNHREHRSCIPIYTVFLACIVSSLTYPWKEPFVRQCITFDQEVMHWTYLTNYLSMVLAWTICLFEDHIHQELYLWYL